MDLSEVIALHQRTKGKVNLEYKRPSGRIGHCFIDGTKPLMVCKEDKDNPGIKSYHYGHDVTTVSQQFLDEYRNFIFVEVYKQTKGVPIWVRPESLKIQNERKAAIVKTLYGTK